MRIAVTGALGHIGSRAIRDLPALLDAGDVEMILIDNLSTQRFPSLFSLPDSVGYRFVEADVASEDLRPHLEGCDSVLHLAAMTDAASSHERATEVEGNNLLCTENVVDACLETGSQLVFCSSTSVYGSQDEVQDESCPVEDLRPQSPYALTKIREESTVTAAVASRGLGASILRLGTIFGTSPGMRFHTAVNRFCWQAAMGQPLTVWRTALDQKRPYLDLVDALQAFALVMSQDIRSGEVMNVVTENATVRRVLDCIRQYVPNLTVEQVDSPIMNQLSYEVSSARIRDRGFQAKGSLEMGVEATLGVLQRSQSLGCCSTR